MNSVTADLKLRHTSFEEIRLEYYKQHIFPFREAEMQCAYVTRSMKKKIEQVKKYYVTHSK
jgi:hypothetical protein